MSLRTPLSRARGLGAAGEGVGRWWRERLTSLALIPLTLWLAFSIALLGTADHAAVTTWVAHPVNTGLLLLTLVVSFWHAAMGVQSVAEDYIATEWRRTAAVVGFQFAAVLLALAGVLAVLHIAYGS
ncbi:MAG: succinate dehydrogenase, hydrophobic membrane anchor protein [Halofilum sp. (in: g-proteobacteria)]